MPAEIAEQIRDRNALANAYLDRVVNGSPASISEAAAFQRGREHLPAFDSENWYITIVFDHEVEIEESEDPIGPEIWWSFDPAEVADRDFRKGAAAVVDSSATHLATLIGSPFFETRVTERDVIVLLGEHRPLSFVPVFGGSAHGAIGRGAEDLPAAEIGRRFRALAGSGASHRRLRTPIARYASALAEEDPWRSFQSLWMALETLIRKVGADHRDAVLASLDSVDDALGAVAAITEVDWTTPGSPLAADFAIVAIFLDPTQVEADRLTFAQIQKTRNKLSHGSVSDDAADAELPVGDLRTLANRYFSLALDHYLAAHGDDADLCA